MFVVAQEVDHMGYIYGEFVCYARQQEQVIPLDTLIDIYHNSVPPECEVVAVDNFRYKSWTGYHKLYIHFEPFLQTKFYDFYAYKIINKRNTYEHDSRVDETKVANIVWSFKGEINDYMVCIPLQPMDIANILQEQKVMAIANALQQ